jgi:predicted membrane-bound spermidine synthase
LREKLFLPAVLAVFTASGFAGLIYESIWSHYLKLFLGHAAYAQTLVLAIFMGGMAGGAWGASRLSPRLRDLLLAYALIEAAIGIASLFFHEIFIAMTALAFDHVVPALGSPGAVQAFKWSLAAALILPQSVLLGATFPLMTGGVLRARPERAGYVVAMLYFTNSLGAAAGVLASGFYFIAAAGLPGTMVAAGVVNLTVAAAALFLRPRREHAVAASPAPVTAAEVSRLRLLLAVAALTGASSFVYEIGWIRMLSLVLGSSTHSFELMLSAFILGIAFGGLAIRRRIDASSDPLRLLGWVQLAMGIAALATLPVYGSSFVVMKTAVQLLAPTETGYVVFNFVSHAISLGVMFPAAFCAGMTLPLITAALLRGGAGERAIGQVYAANTAGAIVGVFAAVHVGMALLGLKGLIVAGAAIDLALGVILLGSGVGGRRRAYAPGAIAVVALIGVLAGVQFDAHRMASGVFRTGVLLHAGGPEQAVLQIDGKTATISVTASGSGSAFALRTNGKSEGVVQLGPGAPTVDELMMTLLGALPQFFSPEARQAATIGFGTGLTSHVLLASPKIETLDTIEIEPAVLVAAERFRPRNQRALDDPRSRVNFDDAKTFFSAQQKQYDVIVSEPSNPWVSGVAGLFSVEFYGQVRRYLRDDGLFLQWVHVYEMTPELIATIIAALGANFDDFEIWMPNHGDMIVVAAKGKFPRLDAGAFTAPLLRAELARFNIRNLDDLLVHRVGGRAAMAPYYGSFGARANSDFAPVLDLNAARARFLREQVDDMPRLMEAPIPVLAFFDRPRAQQPDPARFSEGAHPWIYRAERAKHAELAEAYLRAGRAAVLESLPPPLAANLTLLRAGLVECKLTVGPATMRRALVEVAGLVNAHLARSTREGLWQRLSSSGCARGPGGIASWLRLHAAIAGEDGGGIVKAAQALLKDDLSADLAPYVIAAHMTGLLLGNDRAGALRSFQENRRKLGVRQETWGPVFRFLIGQTTGG